MTKTLPRAEAESCEQGTATDVVVAKGVPTPIAQYIEDATRAVDKTARCRVWCKRFLVLFTVLGLTALASAAIVAEVVRPTWLCAPWQDDCVSLFERRCAKGFRDTVSDDSMDSLIETEARAKQLVVDLDLDGSGVIEVHEVGQILDNLGLLIFLEGIDDDQNQDDLAGEMYNQSENETETSVEAAVEQAKAEAEEMFYDFDRDGDGVLDPMEFMEFVLHQHLTHSGSAGTGLTTDPALSTDSELHIGDVCYRFCEDSALEFIDRRGDCPAGTVCQAGGGTNANTTGLRGNDFDSTMAIGYDNCYSPDVCVVEETFETDEAIVNELARLRNLIDILTADLGDMLTDYDGDDSWTHFPASISRGSYPAGHPCEVGADCASNMCDFDPVTGPEAGSICVGVDTGDALFGWHECADEGGVCSCPGGLVRYGMDGTWADLVLALPTTPTVDNPTGGTASCTNDVFGDPLYGVVKRCECRRDVAPECSHYPFTCSSCSDPPCECRVASTAFFCENMGALIEPIESTGLWESWGEGGYEDHADAGTAHDEYLYHGGHRAREEKGYCVKQNNSDENTGVVKLAWGDHETAAMKQECLRLCREYNAGVGVTGCEMIWDQSNRGCYVHTSPDITHGNGVNRHSCFVGDASRLYAESELPMFLPPDEDTPTYDCDLAANFILNASYSQIVINSLMTPGVTSMAMALDECQQYCSNEAIVPGCTGFFYQQHTNTHQICGFYTTDFDSMNAPTHHGHTEGAVCSKRI